MKETKSFHKNLPIREKVHSLTTTTQITQQTYSTSEDEFLFGFNEHDNNNKYPKATVCLNETQPEIVLDTGATVHIMDDNTQITTKAQ